MDRFISGDVVGKLNLSRFFELQTQTINKDEAVARTNYSYEKRQKELAKKKKKEEKKQRKLEKKQNLTGDKENTSPQEDE